MPRQQDSADRLHQCDKCPYKAKSGGNLTNHKQWNHIGTHCAWPGCNVQTDSELKMRGHLKRAHCEPDKRQVQEGDHSVEKFKCTWPDCDKMHLFHKNAVRCCNFHAYRVTRTRNAQGNGQESEVENEAEDEVEIESGHASEDDSRRELDRNVDRDLDSEPEIKESGHEQELPQNEVILMLTSISAQIEQNHNEFSAKIDNLDRRVDDLESVIKSAIHGDGPERKRVKS
ncbi:hypothetical protein F4781DRAFT_395572 [Annulohypoxylon bovei var. microspora]|nr:hypothetical protein F4781DRAFT_395572 [Annulohypoxylon bovei var. microspora]